MIQLHFVTQEEEAEEEAMVRDDTSFQLDNIEDHVKKLIYMRKKLDINVKKNVKAAQARQKRNYDARHKQGSFNVGDLALLKNMKKLSKKGDKLKPNWFGPYTIAECIGSNNYRLWKKGSKTKKMKSMYNSSRLKLCNTRGRCVYN